MPVSRPAVLIPLVALTVTLTACTPGTPEASGSTTSPVSVAPSATPTPDDSETPEPAPADLRADIIDAMSSGNTAALEGYLAPSVHITYAASEVEGDVTDRARIIDNLSNATSPSATWNFSLSSAVIDNYRNNPGHYPSYVDDFPDGAVVGKSSENKVISFAISAGLITRIFIANDEYALTFE